MHSKTLLNCANHKESVMAKASETESSLSAKPSFIVFCVLFLGCQNQAVAFCIDGNIFKVKEGKAFIKVQDMRKMI